MYNVLKNKRIIFLLFLPVFGFFLLSQINLLVSFVFLLIEFALFLKLKSFKTKFQIIFLFIFVLNCTQYLLMTLLSSYNGFLHIKYLFALNYILILFFIMLNYKYVVFFFNHFKIGYVLYLFLLYLFFISIFSLDINNLLGMATVIRNYTTFIFAFIIGFFFMYCAVFQKFLQLVNIINITFVIIFIYSLYDVFLFNDYFIMNIMKVKLYALGTGINIPPNLGVPLDYYTTFYEWHKIRRAASVFFGPNNTGYFSSFIIILNLFVYILTRNLRYLIIIVSSLLLLILSFSKTNWLIIGFVFFVYFFRKLFKNNLLIKYLLIFFLIFIFFYKEAFINKDKNFSSSGMTSHIAGLVMPFVNSSVDSKYFYIGHGIGTGGTASRLIGERDNTLSKSLVGGESTIGAMFYQLGIIGLLLFVLHFICLLKQYNVIYKKYMKLKILSTSTIFAYFIASTIQENSFSFIPSFMFYFLFGVFYAYGIKLKKR